MVSAAVCIAATDSIAALNSLLNNILACLPKEQLVDNAKHKMRGILLREGDNLPLYSPFAASRFEKHCFPSSF